MEKVDIVKSRILETIRKIAEDSIRTELSVLFTEYDSVLRKYIKEVKRNVRKTD